jgi:hypothetical protein
VVPTFTKQSISQLGAQLYSGSIATATPQAFTVPDLALMGVGGLLSGGEFVVQCGEVRVPCVDDRGGGGRYSPLTTTRFGSFSEGRSPVSRGRPPSAG